MQLAYCECCECTLAFALLVEFDLCPQWIMKILAACSIVIKFTWLESSSEISLSNHAYIWPSQPWQHPPYINLALDRRGEI